MTPDHAIMVIEPKAEASPIRNIGLNSSTLTARVAFDAWYPDREDKSNV